jgi:hypothetical protein
LFTGRGFIPHRGAGRDITMKDSVVKTRTGGGALDRCPLDVYTAQ